MTATLGKIIADFNTTLNLKVVVWATSATLDSATDDDGVALPTWTYFLTFDWNSTTSKEYIKCTLTSTALTSIQSVSRQGALTSGFARTHRKGATVTITDFAIIRKMLDLLDGTTDFNASVPLKYDGTATISNANEFATKAYVDGVAIAGGADASTTVKGITKMSVAPASAASPIAVGDNDPRVPTTDENDALAGTSGTPSTSNKYVTNDDTATAATASKVARRLAGWNVTVVTETTGNSTTNAASTAFVQQEITANTSKVNITTSDTTVTGTASETTIYTTTIAANTLGTNNGVEGRIYFTSTNANTNDKVLKLKYGSTTIATVTMTPDANTSLTFKWYIDFMVLWNASTSAQVGSVKINGVIARINTFNTQGIVEMSGAESGTASEVSTGALALTLSITQSAAETFVAKHAFLRKIN